MFYLNVTDSIQKYLPFDLSKITLNDVIQVGKYTALGTAIGTCAYKMSLSIGGDVI